MGRLNIVEEGEGGSAVDSSSSGRMNEARNNNLAASEAAAAAASTVTSSSTVDPENTKRKAGNSDESGYLSMEKDVGIDAGDISDDGSDIEIVFERKGDKNGNRDGNTTTATAKSHLQPSDGSSSSKRLKTEQQFKTLAEVVVATSSSMLSAKSEGGDSKGKTR